MTTAGEIRWDDRTLDELLKSPEGPVGKLLLDLSVQVADVARSVVRVRDPLTRDRRRRAGRGSTAHPPGYTKALIRPHLGRGTITGSLYGGANAPGSPGIFLEYPARQMDDRYPFLTTGLDSIAGIF